MSGMLRCFLMLFDGFIGFVVSTHPKGKGRAIVSLFFTGCVDYTRYFLLCLFNLFLSFFLPFFARHKPDVLSLSLSLSVFLSFARFCLLSFERLFGKEKLKKTH
ncbi:hypothetical protein QBC44DRAFT_124464 [Cladorrhinum sp. PSN332]|nr:hypothetical protein QBC44DRAFT_124464 [Cladorrhinum sp. PSN332]